MPGTESEFKSRERALRSELARRTDPQERLAWIVEQARRAPGLQPNERTPEREIPGCASRLWLLARREGRCCRFRCDSESAILKAIALQMCHLYDGLPLGDTSMEGHADFLGWTELGSLLTENRRRTLRRLEDAIREALRGN